MELTYLGSEPSIHCCFKMKDIIADSVYSDHRLGFRAITINEIKFNV